MDIELHRLQLPDTCWARKSAKSRRKVLLKVANLRHVVSIVVDPKIVELPVEHLEYDFSPHNESAIPWPDVLKSNVNDLSALEIKKRAKASLPVPSNYFSTMGVLGVLSVIG